MILSSVAIPLHCIFFIKKNTNLVYAFFLFQPPDMESPRAMVCCFESSHMPEDHEPMLHGIVLIVFI